ncbi:MAG: hydrogenase maturation nickel metallochaperone HypA [Gaiellaceae bacterium]
MHELSLADAVVQICCEHAEGRRVAGVEVRVGRLRQVVPDSLAFAFELVAVGTPVEGAELEIVEVPARVRCAACDAETEVDRFPLVCGRCGGFAVDVVAGEECHVESLEIEHAPVAVAGR